MVSEHLRIRNKKLLLYEYLKRDFDSLEMLSGVYVGVILFSAFLKGLLRVFFQIAT